MTEVAELHGWVPQGPLFPEDITKVVLDARFEISDGKLEIMPPPSPWHQYSSRDVERLLDARHASALSDVPLLVGDSGRRPDVIATSLTREEIMRKRIRTATPDMVEVAVEIISHDEDRRRDAVAVKRDRETKAHEYAQAGIAEYWILDEVPGDPVDASVEIYHLRDGAYVAAAVVRLSALVSGEVQIPMRE
ncbi:MAG: Uma2 family endonuclease [Hamadaea sp.]|nr:Uma2 family endonuclease [Hamadaea sp.]